MSRETIHFNNFLYNTLQIFSEMIFPYNKKKIDLIFLFWIVGIFPQIIISFKPKMSNTIYSNANKKNMSSGIISREEATGLYNGLMAKWTNQDIWTFCRHTNRLVGMSLDEWIASVGSSNQFTIATGHTECKEFNNREHPATDGRKWFQLVIQPTKPDEMEMIGIDPISLMVCGFMVSGFVYHFADEQARDIMYCKINHKCMYCRLRQPLRNKQTCLKCEEKTATQETLFGVKRGVDAFGKKQSPVNIRDAIMEQDPELFKNPSARAGMEAAIAMTMKAEASRLPTEIEMMIDAIKKEDAERVANEWGEWVVKNEPVAIKVVIKHKNPPKDGAKKNIPAKPPAFIKSGSAGCKISNHLAVKKWMDKYGDNK